jgi:hypothetical protein
MTTMDVRGYMQLAKAAPYSLACVLFAHYTDMKDYAFKLAPAAYGWSMMCTASYTCTFVPSHFVMCQCLCACIMHGMNPEDGPD